MKKMTLDLKNISKFVSESEFNAELKHAEEAFNVLNSKSGAGNDFLGWLDWPLNYDKEEFERIKKAAEKIRKQSQVLIVIGIGGSYLGARAAISMLEKAFGKDDLEIVFCGNNISSKYTYDLIEYIKDKDFSINVISKSGTTTEPAIAFRIFKKICEERYGEGAKDRIFATTDKARGALKKLATEKGYETFVVPDDIGGRFSVTTAVGLLPIACAGISIDELMKGANDAYKDFKNFSKDNDAVRYALSRYLLYKKGYKVEMLINYEPAFFYFAEWWKQLFGESEGKDNKGILPTSASFSTDLHSLGQYIQEGERMLFETVLNLETPLKDITIEADDANLDGLNYLAGKTISYVNHNAYVATVLAHVDGGVPNIAINVPELSGYMFGYLSYFFFKSCGISAYLIDVNPFNQPGVEAYKKNMFALLGKQGYEDLRKEIDKKLK